MSVTFLLGKAEKFTYKVELFPFYNESLKTHQIIGNFSERTSTSPVTFGEAERLESVQIDGNEVQGNHAQVFGVFAKILQSIDNIKGSAKLNGKTLIIQMNVVGG